jgi:hypothetical protein
VLPPRLSTSDFWRATHHLLIGGPVVAAAAADDEENENCTPSVRRHAIPTMSFRPFAALRSPYVRILLRRRRGSDDGAFTAARK